MEAAVVEREGTVVRLRGPVNLASVPSLLDECQPAAGAAGMVVDLAGASMVDSAALALVMSLRRTVEAAGGAFELRNPPEALRTLADLYGVGFLIGNLRPDA